MTKFYLKNVGNLGYTGSYTIPEQLKDLKEVYLYDLFSELQQSDGSGHQIYLSKFMATYRNTLKNKYPKASVIIADEFTSETRLSDWY